MNRITYPLTILTVLATTLLPAAEVTPVSSTVPVKMSVDADTSYRMAGETPSPQTFARFVPERKDDFAWENDKIAFRAYGPALRERPENNGFDCWLKRVDYPIINKWYAEHAAGKSYHEDHGEGLDNYKVGSSAGCGGTGIWLDGKREPLETYRTWTLHEQTPQITRFTLTYEREINGTTYGEEKTITIELGRRLFSVHSVFTKDGEPAPDLPICIGLTTHEGHAETAQDRNAGWIATWETIGDSELGTGARMAPEEIIEIKEVLDKENKDASHIFLITQTNDNGEIAYEAGYGWKKAGAITSLEEWTSYLER